MKGCHFKHTQVDPCYEAEALKDDIWYGLVYSPDEGIYYWEQAWPIGDVSLGDFKTEKEARQWMFKSESVEDEI